MSLVAIPFEGTINAGMCSLGISTSSYAVVSIDCDKRCAPYVYNGYWFCTFADWQLGVLSNGTSVSGTAYCLRNA